MTKIFYVVNLKRAEQRSRRDRRSIVFVSPSKAEAMREAKRETTLSGESHAVCELIQVFQGE